MRKIFMIFMIFVLSAFSYADSNRIVNIKTMSFDVKEKNYVGSKTKNINYSIKMKRPNIIKKIVTSPEMNKGEIYIYKDNKKNVYLPFFNQVTTKKVEEDENYLLRSINAIFDLEDKDEAFRKRYYDKQVQKLSIGNGYLVEIISYKTTNSYLLPNNFIIYQNDVKIANLEIKSMEVNPQYDKKEFEFRK